MINPIQNFLPEWEGNVPRKYKVVLGRERVFRASRPIFMLKREQLVGELL